MPERKKLHGHKLGEVIMTSRNANFWDAVNERGGLLVDQVDPHFFDHEVIAFVCASLEARALCITPTHIGWMAHTYTRDPVR